jgi:hypothetical protein
LIYKNYPKINIKIDIADKTEFYLIRAGQIKQALRNSKMTLMKKMTSACLSPQANLMKHFLTGFFVLVALTCTYAQKTNVGNGAWNNAATWSPSGVPGGSDDVTIIAGTTVTVPANAFCKRLYITGTLDMSGASGITMDISNNSVASTTNGIQLNSGGVLNIGATNTVYFSNGQASGIVNNGGSIVSTGTNGMNGGTILANTCCGGGFGVSGTASTTIYNLNFLHNANFNIASGGLVVNGTLTVVDNNFSASGTTLSPIYGAGSTLSINNNNQGISGGGPLNGNLNKLWSAQSGTIGVTAGYPNNVTLMNFGTSSGGINVPPIVNVGWRPGAIAIGLNGALRLGDGTGGSSGSLVASLDQVTSFICGGIIVDNASTLIGPPTAATFQDKGNFILQGATTGLFYSYGATIDFSGSGTSGSPQVISTTGASGAVTFANVKVSNGTYVQLQDDVNITGTLTFTSGYIGTSTTNSLTVTNTASTAITGGSSTAYVDGPLSWSMPSTTSGNYVFPIGDLSGGAYLPLTFSSANSAGGTTVTAEGFKQNSNGNPDLTISAISPTEYWKVSTTNPFSGSTLVDATRPTAVSPYNALGTSATSNGVYTVAGGSPSGTSILDGGLGGSSPVFITMVNAFLNPVRVGGTNASVDASCVATSGSLIVGGVGGTPGYTYSVAGFNGGAFQASNTFSPLAKGSYTVTIKDNLNNTKTKVLKVLGPVQINGNDQDVDICSGQSTTLTASNLDNSTATYTWTSSPAGVYPSTASITVSPTVPTTYTVTSTIYANNLLPDGGFETGTPAGFVAGYSFNAGGYGTTPGSGGYYKIAGSGNSLCTFFTTLAPQEGSNYYIADGNTASTDVFSINTPSLTAGVTYRFSYWYAEGSNDVFPQLRTQANGVTLGTVTVNNYLGWTQANYSFVAIGGVNAIKITNMFAPGNTNGDDFYIDNMQLLAPCTVNTSMQVTINCTLPVDLLDFNAVKKGQGALLTWETTGEKNSSYFIVEKSLDGVHFSSIGKVDAVGNSSTLQGYSFVDPSITAGITYYRLAEYDVDGTVHYSVIKVVSKEGITGIQIVPNPNNGIFAIILNNTGDVTSQVSVLNSLGQVVFVGAETKDNLMNVDISQLAAGVYYLQVITDEDKIVKKIVKE